ncbi:MAG: class I SAM-dependent methyltransferase [Rhodothermales bacterium]|nr:class I SAM-dependent methyltransferase [Rhodothermales bacterium]
MDIWKYFAIGHEHHVFWNPLSEAKVDELIELLALPDEAQVVDIGCGKAEFLVRTVRRWNCSAVGVDMSPYCVADARAKIEAAGLASAVEIVEANGSDYSAKPLSFDAAVCLGASWIWGGLEGTLRALSSYAIPGGLVLVGEPFWRTAPSREHLEAAEFTESSFGTHIGNIQTGLRMGLGLLHAVVSNEDDWDRYEGYQWYAAEKYSKHHRDDPDVRELLDKVRKSRDHYLEWGRKEIGWAVYLFVKDPS